MLVDLPAASMAANTFSSRSVVVRSTHSAPIAGRMLAPSSWRAFSIVAGALTRAWRDFRLGATFGHPAANQSSITSSNVSDRCRAGPGTERLGPQRQQLVEVVLGVGLLDPLDLPARAVGEPHPRHPPALRLVPPHRRPLRHPDHLRRSQRSREATSNWLRRSRITRSSSLEVPLTRSFQGGGDGTRTHDPLLAKQVL